jgi:hypothetical protein
MGTEQDISKLVDDIVYDIMSAAIRDTDMHCNIIAIDDTNGNLQVCATLVADAADKRLSVQTPEGSYNASFKLVTDIKGTALREIVEYIKRSMNKINPEAYLSTENIYKTD